MSFDSNTQWRCLQRVLVLAVVALTAASGCRASARVTFDDGVAGGHGAELVVVPLSKAEFERYRTDSPAPALLATELSRRRFDDEYLFVPGCHDLGHEIPVVTVDFARSTAGVLVIVRGMGVGEDGFVRCRLFSRELWRSRLGLHVTDDLAVDLWPLRADSPRAAASKEGEG
ncbi:MAG: hypothetical protein AB7O52_03660 [Planctomycetota bacterium]